MTTGSEPGPNGPRLRPDSQFTGRIPGNARAVVTGGSSGIGAAIVERLQPTFTVCEMSRRSGVDVTDPDAVAFRLDQFVDEHGTPELLVNCAGITDPASFLEMPVESFRRQIDVNLTGTFIVSQEFVRRVSGPGMIVNVASTAGTRPSPGWAAYAASKAALINLSQTMAAELEPHGIRVYCLVPGRCATPLRRILEPEEDQATIMQPDEVARVVENLFRDPGLLTGQPILVRRP